MLRAKIEFALPAAGAATALGGHRAELAMTARIRRILGWSSVGAIYAGLGLIVILCAGFVFHRLSVERFSIGYSRVWVKPWTEWHHADLAMSSTRGIQFQIDGPTEEDVRVPR